MIGCSFVVNREYFGKLGLFDSAMDVYGGENIELGIKVRAAVAGLFESGSCVASGGQNASMASLNRFDP